VATDHNELEDYESLLASPGYARLMDRFHKEWGRTGQRYLDTLEKMANTIDKAQAADEIQRVIWVRKELEQFFASVTSHVQSLRNASVPQEVLPSRRGVL
jgi:hypothetical protein